MKLSLGNVTLSQRSNGRTTPLLWKLSFIYIFQAVLTLSIFVALPRWTPSSTNRRQQQHGVQTPPHLQESEFEYNKTHVTTFQHYRRTLSDDAWMKKVQKGREIQCAFGMPIHSVSQSPWLEWSALAEWGWTDTLYKDMYVESGMQSVVDLVDTLKDFLAANNCDAALVGGQWQDSNVGHDNDYTRPGTDQQEKHTGAQYSAWLSKQDLSRPLWLRQSSYAPAYEIQKKGLLGVRPPDLQRWSDISALQYYHHMGGSEDGVGRITPPSMMVIPQIVRGEGKTDTLDAIDKAHELIKKPLSDFPGVTFDATSAHETFLGLLGTAHGSGPGFFLAQHKAWFGNMRIESIQVWVKPAKQPIYHMAFSIVPISDQPEE